MADVATPEFSADDATALLLAATLPSWRPDGSGAVEVVDVAPLPSYDDKNWLVTARVTAAAAPAGSEATAEPTTTRRAVVKVSLVMPVPRVRGQAAVMRALTDGGVPVPPLVPLGRAARPDAAAVPAALVTPATDADGAVGCDECVWGWRQGDAGVASVCVIDFVPGSCNLFDHPRRATLPSLRELGRVMGAAVAVVNGGSCAHDPAVLAGLRRAADPAAAPTDPASAEGWGPWDGRCQHVAARRSLAGCRVATAALCEPHIAAFEARVAPLLRAVPPTPLDATIGGVAETSVPPPNAASLLPWGLIHSDFNEFNVLVARPTPDEAPDTPVRVTGVIDFGDCCYSHRVFEIAHGATYMLQNILRDQFPNLIKREATDGATAATFAVEGESSAAATAALTAGLGALCQGFAERLSPPMTAAELRAVLPAAMNRTAMSVATGEASATGRAGLDAAARTYLLSNSASGRAALRLLAWAPDGAAGTADGPRVDAAALVEAIVAAVLPTASP